MNLVIDIETVSCDEMPPLDSIKVPATHKKPESILAFQQEHQEEAWRKQALSSMEGRIIAIGYCFEDGPPTSICSLDEQEVVASFSAFVDKLQRRYGEPITWVHWNGLSFDIPWLFRKAARFSLVSLRNALRKDNRIFHVDLMKVWSADYRDYVSLASCAKFLGIEHIGGGGDEIHNLWQEGKLDVIEAHNQRDLETTRNIYKRIFG